MSTYSNILVAIDGSDESERILDKALKIADDNGAQLSVVLVFEPLLGNYSFELNMADLEKAQQEYQEQVAKQVRESLASKTPPVPESRIHFQRGKAATEIRKLADELKADLLVIGSHGHNPIRAVLGSVANAVLHGINCDVLTVRV